MSVDVFANIRGRPICDDPLSNMWLDATPITAIGHRETARRTGYSKTAIAEWTRNGRIRADRADRVAIALGHHPAELWPDWWEGATL